MFKSIFKISILELVLVLANIALAYCPILGKKYEQDE